MTFAPFIITLILLRFMDSQINAHYDIYGNFNRLGSKYETLIIPIVITLFSLAFNWLTKKITTQYKNTDNDTTKKDKKV